MKALIVVIGLAVVMGGCAGSGGYIPVADDVINNAGEHTVQLAGFTKDASVAKEESVMRTLRWRDTQYQKAHAVSGFQLEMAMVDAGAGIKLYLPKTISFKEAPHFDQPLPTKPSDHAVWNTVNTLGGKIVDKTFFGWAVSELAGVVKEGWDNIGTKYNGPVEMYNSNNNAGYGQQFAGAPVYRGPYQYSEAVESVAEVPTGD